MIWEKSRNGWLLSKLYELAWKKIEAIPDDQIMLRAITPHHIDDEGAIHFKIFQDSTGVSCNLSRFSTHEQARLGLGNPPERNVNSGLLSFAVSDVKDTTVNGKVDHHPTDTFKGRENYSHCMIFPADTTKKKLSVGQAKKLLKKTTVAEQFLQSKPDGLGHS